LLRCTSDDFIANRNSKIENRVNGGEPHVA
jgi:hypothetical protein